MPEAVATKAFRVLVSDPIEPAGLAALEPVAHVDHRPGLAPEALAAIVGEYDALVVRSQTQVTEAVLAAAGKLRIIGRAGVGVDNIDVPAATRRGVVVVNSPSGNTIAAAEHTLALMLALTRRVSAADASVKRGEWKRSAYVGAELFGKTLAVLGFGKIGSHVAKVAQALGMRVLAYDPYLTPERASELGVEPVSDLEALLPQADYLSLHLPKTAETANLLSAERLAKLKPGARIVNCARGGLIDEAALAEAIAEGRVAGAALDVFAAEPEVPEALKALGDRVILTPHLGASTEEAQLNVAIDVAEQIASVLTGGEARAAVNLPALGAELRAQIGPYLPLAEKLGRVAAQLAEGPVESLTVTYSGALAELSTKPLTTALLKGLLSPALAEGVNFVNAPFLARERGIAVAEARSEAPGDYAELVTVTVRTPTRARTIAGTLLGADRATLVQLDDYAFNLFLTGTLLFAPHRDVPGSVGRIGTLLGERSLNIYGMQLGRSAVGGPALMALNLDTPADAAAMGAIAALPGFFDITQVTL